MSEFPALVIVKQTLISLKTLHPCNTFMYSTTRSKTNLNLRTIARHLLLNPYPSVTGSVLCDDLDDSWGSELVTDIDI